MGLGMPVTMIRFWHRSPMGWHEKSRLLAWIVVAGGMLVGSGFLAARCIACSECMGAARNGADSRFGWARRGIYPDGFSRDADGVEFSKVLVTLVGSGVLRLAGVLVAFLVLPVLSVRSTGWVFGGSFVAGPFSRSSALLRVQRSLRSAVSGSRSLLRGFVAFGLPILGSTFVVAAIEYVDILVIAATLSPHRVGLYSAAVRLSTIQATILATLTAVALPLATKADAGGKRAIFLRDVVSFGVVLAVVVTLVLGGFSSLWVRLVYGPSYSESALVFLVISLGLMPNFVGNPASQMVYAAGIPGFCS
jgi:O-antigen/teichoic acid export membrane protein